MGGAAGQNYVSAGLERLAEARILIAAQYFAGGAYLAGRAVECLLRSLIYKHDAEIRIGRKPLETGHNLTELLRAAARAGALNALQNRRELTAAVQFVNSLWLNNMRFESNGELAARWRRLGATGRKRSIKWAIHGYLDVATAVTKKCERLWQS